VRIHGTRLVGIGSPYAYAMWRPAASTSRTITFGGIELILCAALSTLRMLRKVSMPSGVLARRLTLPVGITQQRLRFCRRVRGERAFERVHQTGYSELRRPKLSRVTTVPSRFPGG